MAAARIQLLGALVSAREELVVGQAGGTAGGGRREWLEHLGGVVTLGMVGSTQQYTANGALSTAAWAGWAGLYDFRWADKMGKGEPNMWYFGNLKGEPNMW